MHMTFSRIRTIVGFALAIALPCAVNVGATPAGAAQLNWSGPTQADESGGTPSAIACPSESLCVGVDSAGAILHTGDPLDSSPSWGKAKSGSVTGLTAISCPSSSLCVAVGEHGDALNSTNPSGGNGAWNHESLPGGPILTGVSCPSAGLCVAVDSQGSAFTTTDPTATTPSWSEHPIDSGTALKSVACPSESLCVAVDADGNVLTTTSPAGGGSWSAARRAFGELIALSCPSTGLCVAADSIGDILASANPGAAHPTWNTTLGLAGEPLAVSCAATELCAIATHGGGVLASYDPTAAEPFSPAVPADHTALPDIACVPAGACLALDAGGGFVRGLVPKPEAVSAPASEVSATEATLNATVAPNDGTLSQCEILYGPTVAYGQSAPCASTPSPSGGSQSVHARVSGLAADSAYHFALLATNPGGTAVSADATFTTLKAVSLVTPYPSISGVPGVGERMYCNPGVPSGSTATLAYQWVRDSTPIAKATNSSYVIQSADAKHHLQCRVTTTDAAGSITAGSAFVAVPATGIVAAVGETKIARLTSSGPVLSVPVTCSQQAAGGCSISIRITAAVIQTRPHRASRHVTLTLASGQTHLKRGERRTIKLTLNATGRRLLAKSHLLHVKVAITGTVIGALQAKLATTALTMRATSAHAAGRASAHPAQRPR